MRPRITKTKFYNLLSSVDIGRKGETAATRVEIDCRAALEHYPGATAAITHAPPKGEEYTPPDVRVENGVLIWDVSASDVAESGRGRLQISILGPNGENYKSAITNTFVGESLGPATGTPSSGMQHFLDEGARTLAQARQAAQDAEDAAQDAQDVADEIRAARDRGEFNGKDGKDGKDGERGAQGLPGKDGADGKDGKDGLDAPQIDDTKPSLENPYSGAKVEAVFRSLGLVQIDGVLCVAVDDEEEVTL